MLLLLSGEGPSDIGATVNEEGLEIFSPGPLAMIVDSMVGQMLSYSPLSLGYVRHCARPKLAATAKALKPRPVLVIPGAKRRAGNAADYRQAFALATIAKEIEEREGDAVIVVLFRDSDGTRSDETEKWDDLVLAIESAFKSAGFARGVAMVAKPKQEAWFMCAFKNDRYQHCSILEDASGNDNSPNSLKRMLEEALGRPADRSVLIELVEGGDFDHTQIDMPSFNRFREALQNAVNF